MALESARSREQGADFALHDLGLGFEVVGHVEQVARRRAVFTAGELAALPGLGAQEVESIAHAQTTPQAPARFAQMT